MKKLLMMIGATAIAVASNVALATDLDDYYFRYDFSSGAKVFCGSDVQPTDPLVTGADKIDMAVFAATGPDGENTAVHPGNNAWSSVSSDFINVLNADWTLAMSVRPGKTPNGVLFSIGRRAKNQKGISICSSSDTQQLIVDENIKDSSSSGSQRQNIILDTGIELTKGFHTVIVAYEKPASGDAGTIKLWVDGVFQKSLTTDDKQFGAGFQFCATCSGNLGNETSTCGGDDPDVAFRDVRFYSSMFTGSDVKRYAATYPADTLRPSAAVRSYGVNCIDTGYYTKSTTSYLADFQFVSIKEQARLFGARGELGCNLYLRGGSSSGYLGCAIQDGGAGWANLINSKLDTVRMYATLSATGASAYYKNKFYSATLSGTANNEANIPTQIFAEIAEKDADPSNFSTAHIYSFGIAEGGTPVHFFVPATNETGAAGFYDVIGARFHGEAMESPKTALKYYDGFGAVNDYKYEDGTLYAKVYVASANVAKGAVAVSLDGSPLTPESDGGYWVAYGSVLTLTAVPESGYDVSKWVGDVRMIQGGTASDAAITVKIDKAAQFEARFDVSADAEIFHSTAVGRFAKRAQDFDVGDYIQTGLVGHFDGIRNAGADAPHDPAADSWKNLVMGKPDAAFFNYTDDNGYWTDDGKGFYFGGVGKNCYARLKSPGLTLGSSLTVQIAVDVKTSEQSGGSAGKNKYPGYFHGADNSIDFGIYSANNSGSIKDVIIFKGGSESSRPSVAAWGGRYATAMIDAGKSYLFEGTNRGDSYDTNHDLLSDNNVQFSWGGSPVNANRAVVGTYYNVRIYDCALTEPQLEWNRFVDDVRYFGGGVEKNLVVAPNARGLEGVEPSGEYMVNGSWTFTATNITDGVFTWVPDGYRLEKWDGSDWVFSKNEEGASFAYTNCTANGRMRLTWLWRQTGTVKGGYDVGDYIQENLILHFDGIRNAGATADHDSSATTWVNLGTLGSEHNAEKTLASAPPTGAADGEWYADGYRLKGTEYFPIGGTATLGGAATVQIAADYEHDDQVANYPTFFGEIADDYDNFLIYFNRVNGDDDNKKKLFFKLLTKTTHGASSVWSGPFATVMYDNANKRVSVGNGVEADWITSNASGNILEYTYAIGATRKINNRLLVATVKSVRVYDKVLSDFELRHNRAIDAVRFYGNVTVVNGAVGETGAVGASSVADGVYDIASGTWTVTAPEVVEGGRRYKPRLTVETLTDGEWVKTSRAWTDSYTVDKTALGSNRIRLTWTWEICNGLIILFR